MHRTWLLSDKHWIMGHTDHFGPKGEFKFINGVLNKPEEPFFFRDKPWEKNGIGGITMLLENGIYRLWYEALSGEYSDHSLILCYAESRDGVHFEKPSLGLIEFNGNTNNNIAFSGNYNEFMGFGGHCMFVDPISPPEARYRMMYLCAVKKSNRPEQSMLHMSFAYSADGIRWKTGVPEFRSWLNPPVAPFGCDCNCVVYYDPDKRSYVGYFRTWNQSDIRCIGYSQTTEFDRWSTPKTIYEPDEFEPLTTDFYGGTDTRYESGGDAIHYMFIPAYNHLTETTDGQLALSRDGEHYKRHERKSFVANDKKYDSAASYLQHGIITVGDTCYVIGEGTTLTHGTEVDGYSKYKGCLYRAWVEKDRFAGVKTDSEFEFNLYPFRYEGGELEITVNADIRKDGYIKCALTRGHGPLRNPSAVDGFSEGDCIPVAGNSINHKIRFKSGVPGDEHQNEELEIRIYMKNATLFSVSVDQ